MLPHPPVEYYKHADTNIHSFTHLPKKLISHQKLDYSDIHKKSRRERLRYNSPVKEFMKYIQLTSYFNIVYISAHFFLACSSEKNRLFIPQASNTKHFQH